MVNIVLPELGEGIVKATVVCWHKKPGETVRADDDICEVVTDKASFNVQAPVSGVLESIAVAQGKEGLIGGILGSIRV